MGLRPLRLEEVPGGPVEGVVTSEEEVLPFLVEGAEGDVPPFLEEDLPLVEDGNLLLLHSSMEGAEGVVLPWNEEVPSAVDVVIYLQWEGVEPSI